jgi:hypothetical protein
VVIVAHPFTLPVSGPPPTQRRIATITTNPENRREFERPRNAVALHRIPAKARLWRIFFIGIVADQG